MADYCIELGDFVEANEGRVKGRLVLSFQSECLNLDSLWQHSTTLAHFLSVFWGGFLPSAHMGIERTRKQVQGEIMYVAGELLGNAIKFSNQTDFLAEICLYLHDEELRFYVQNSVDPDDIAEFQNFIRALLTQDTSALFLEQIEKSTEHASRESGVGLLTLINDYEVDLAWKFEKSESGADIVTTLARMPISWVASSGENG